MRLLRQAPINQLGGLIGLGGAEFRLPLLIAVFELYPQRAIRINLLISLATLAVSMVARFGLTHDTHVIDFAPEIAAMVAGGIFAAWIGAAALLRIPKHRLVLVIAVLLFGVAGLLVLETVFAGSTHLALPPDSLVRVPVALAAGLVVGAVSSLLGVAARRRPHQRRRRRRDDERSRDAVASARPYVRTGVLATCIFMQRARRSW